MKLENIKKITDNQVVIYYVPIANDTLKGFLHGRLCKVKTGFLHDDGRTMALFFDEDVVAGGLDFFAWNPKGQMVDLRSSYIFTREEFEAVRNNKAELDAWFKDFNLGFLGKTIYSNLIRQTEIRELKRQLKLKHPRILDFSHITIER